MPLHLKLEGLLERAYKKACGQDLKKNYLMPDESIFGDIDELIEEYS